MRTTFTNTLKETVIMLWILLIGEAIAISSGRQLNSRLVIMIVTIMYMYDTSKENKRNIMLDTILVMTAQLMLG